MGRAASHITLECALQTHPQLALVSEEVEANQWGLKDVVRQASRGGAGEARGRRGRRSCLLLLAMCGRSSAAGPPAGVLGGRPLAMHSLPTNRDAAG